MFFARVCPITLTHSQTNPTNRLPQYVHLQMVIDEDTITRVRSYKVQERVNS
jgi:hypothetical protein